MFSQTGYNDEATFTVNFRNTFNLVHNGYEFRKHRKTSAGAIYWYCRRQKDLKCKVKAHTMQIGTRNHVRITGEHLHPPGE